MTLVREYESVAGFVATASPAGLEQLAAHADVRAVDLDEVGWGALDESVSQIRADVIHNRGIIGSGTVIAILDTGVDSTHPDIADAVIDEECFCSRPHCCPNGGDRQSGPGAAATRNDHGMNVAGIALSRGHISPIGVAPGAQLVSIKVLDDTTFGVLSDWLLALDWIAINRPDVRVINMSMQTSTVYHSACDSSGAFNMMLSDLVERLYHRGTLLFAAAGNTSRGQSPSIDAIASPACIRRVVAVGAVDDDDGVAGFSDSAAILDLLAPGVEIVSDGVGNRTSQLSGTSMAAPHATGVAALLYSANPSAGAGLIESAMKVGVVVTDQRNNLAFPRIDAVTAFNAVSHRTEFLLGGGATDTDCLLRWNFLPPSIARDGARPFAACSDNDPSCDQDTIEGQCTFALDLCFRSPDPRLPRCSVGEPLLGYELTWPRSDGPGNAPANAESIIQALPAFPVTSTEVCTVPFPYVVTRPPGATGRGIDAIRLAVRTATRRDYDRVSLICNPPGQ